MIVWFVLTRPTCVSSVPPCQYQASHLTIQSILYCMLMIGCLLISVEGSAVDSPHQTSSPGRCKFNLTEVEDEGVHKHYKLVLQPVNTSANEDYSPGCRQCEYLLPAPGPHLLILLNFTHLLDKDSTTNSTGNTTHYLNVTQQGKNDVLDVGNTLDRFNLNHNDSNTDTNDSYTNTVSPQLINTTADGLSAQVNTTVTGSDNDSLLRASDSHQESLEQYPGSSDMLADSVTLGRVQHSVGDNSILDTRKTSADATSKLSSNKENPKAIVDKSEYKTNIRNSRRLSSKVNNRLSSSSSHPVPLGAGSTPVNHKGTFSSLLSSSSSPAIKHNTQTDPPVTGEHNSHANIHNNQKHTSNTFINKLTKSSTSGNSRFVHFHKETLNQQRKKFVLSKAVELSSNPKSFNGKRSSQQETSTETTAHKCSLKVIIEQSEETTSRGGSENKPQVICWTGDLEKGREIALVYRYTVPVKVTYLWAQEAPSTLSLQFQYLGVDEVECHFQCKASHHLCLVTSQLCDGHVDCPDGSDESSTTCNSVSHTSQEHIDNSGKELSSTLIAGIVLPCTLVVAALVALFLMIKHSQSRHARQRSDDALLSQPSSNTSEICQSSQESSSGGQSDALLPDRPPRYSSLQHDFEEDTARTYHQHVLTYTATGVVSSIQPAPPEYQQIAYDNFSNNNDTMDYQVKQAPQQYSGLPMPPGVLGYQHAFYSYVTPSNNTERHDNREYNYDQDRQLCCNNQPTPSSSLSSSSCVPPVSSSHPTMHQHPSCSSITHNRSAVPSTSCPPHISISLDGEEGYSASQRALHTKRQVEHSLAAEYSMMRAPPNRSALERDSPPPPYSQPVHPSQRVPGGFSLDSLLTGSGILNVLPPFMDTTQRRGTVSGAENRPRRGVAHSNPQNRRANTPTDHH